MKILKSAETLSLYLILFILLLIFSCTEKMDVQLGDHKTNLVIEAEVSDSDSAYAMFYLSQPFNSNTNPVVVLPDTVLITDDKGNRFDLRPNALNIYKADVLGKEGTTYYLKVVYNGKEYTSQSTMPQKVSIDSAYSWQFFGTQSNERVLAIRIQDPANQKNFYRYFSSLSKYKYVFEDKLINGSRFSLNAGRDLVKVGDTTTITLLNIDKNNFEYWNVLIQNGTLSNNQSAAPADPRSNIQGGAYGYFSAHSVSKQTIVVK